MGNFFEAHVWAQQLLWLLPMLVGVVLIIIAINTLIHNQFYGWAYVLGEGMVANPQSTDKILGMVINANLWGITIISGEISHNALPYFRCMNMLPWCERLPRTSKKLKKYIPMLELFRLKEKFLTDFYEMAFNKDEQDLANFLQTRSGIPGDYYLTAKINWIRYLRTKNWDFPLKVLYDDGIVSRKIRANHQPVTFYINHKLNVGFVPVDGSEPIDIQHGKILLEFFIKFNNTLYALGKGILWDDFIVLGQGHYLYRYGILNDKVSWYIKPYSVRDDSGRKIHLYMKNS